MSARHATILGASGFIGTHLAARLQAEGYCVTCADTRPPRERIDGVRYITADVRELSDFPANRPLGTIWNLAAVHATPGHPSHEYYATNIAGASQVTTLARRSAAREIVFTSSIAVYGAGAGRRSERSRPAPDSAYGWSKLLAEGIHRDWAGECRTRRLIICRPAAVFGPGEGGNFSRLARLARLGLFVYPGRRDTIKACIYIGDLIEAMLGAHARLPQADGAPLVFNACYPDRYTIEQIVETLRARHFPRLRTAALPEGVLRLLAALLAPVSGAGLGFHPERVRKLTHATDIVPAWLTEHGLIAPGRLPEALDGWARRSAGRFD